MIESIEHIRIKISEGTFEFSQHALDQSVLRQTSVREIREAIQTGEIIENYPNDKYGPSCLVLGYTGAGRALHVQCSYPARPVLKVITCYEPNPENWFEFRQRRTSSGE